MMTFEDFIAMSVGTLGAAVIIGLLIASLFEAASAGFGWIQWLGSY